MGYVQGEEYYIKIFTCASHLSGYDHIGKKKNYSITSLSCHILTEQLCLRLFVHLTLVIDEKQLVIFSRVNCLDMIKVDNNSKYITFN